MFAACTTSRCLTLLTLPMITTNRRTGATAGIALAFFIAVFINFFYRFLREIIYNRYSARRGIVAFAYI